LAIDHRQENAVPIRRRECALSWRMSSGIDSSHLHREPYGAFELPKNVSIDFPADTNHQLILIIPPILDPQMSGCPVLRSTFPIIPPENKLLYFLGVLTGKACAKPDNRTFN
jgi:hypothetical protein